LADNALWLVVDDTQNFLYSLAGNRSTIRTYHKEPVNGSGIWRDWRENSGGREIALAGRINRLSLTHV
jgi:hypothetical protein